MAGVGGGGESRARECSCSGGGVGGGEELRVELWTFSPKGVDTAQFVFLPLFLGSPLGSKLLTPFCSQASSKQYKAVLLPEKLVLSNQLGTNSIFSLTVRIRKVCERVSLTRELDCQSLHSDDWRKTRRRMLSAFLFRLKSGRQVTYSPSGTTFIFDPWF